MKNLIIILASLAMFGSLLSCKKEAKLEIEDFPNANFRILKVEQTQAINMPPFLMHGKITAFYNYVGDSIQVSLVRQKDQVELSPILILKKNMLNFEIQHSKSYNLFRGMGSLVAGLNYSYIRMGDNGIESLSDDVLHTFIYSGTGQIRKLNYIYENNRLKGISGRTQSDPFNVLEGNALDLSVLRYAGDRPIEIVERSYLNLQILDYSLPSPLALSTIGRELAITATYAQENTGVPQELVRRINNALLGLSKGPLEDYEIFQWQSDFLFSGNTFFKDSELVGNPFLNYEYGSSLADWMWTFAHADFNTISVQNQIISSKHMVGKKMVDIVNGEPVYQAVDSTTAFPYTHDPIARTLEIAGLKIWYEVVE
jgi:hypothetical protein